MATLRRWSITLVTAVVTATVLLAAGLLAFGASDRRSAEAAPAPLAAADSHRTPPRLQQSGERVGPEGVPIPAGAPLGPARSPRPGQASGGVVCGAREQLSYHVHAHLTLFVNGKPKRVPLGIGIGAPVRTTETAAGPFASSGSCFSFLHTHAADGIIHIEAPGKVAFKLGQFFDVWQQRLDPRHLGRFSGHVVAYLNGKRYHGDPRAIPLVKHAEIQLEVGGRRAAPQAFRFPQGL
jgi:hypothetical protein